MDKLLSQLISQLQYYHFHRHMSIHMELLSYFYEEDIILFHHLNQLTLDYGPILVKYLILFPQLNIMLLYIHINLSFLAHATILVTELHLIQQILMLQYVYIYSLNEDHVATILVYQLSFSMIIAQQLYYHPYFIILVYATILLEE